MASLWRLGFLLGNVMIKAILFDSDGVLVDSEQFFFEATCIAFKSAGAALSCNQWAKWYLGEGKRSREVAELVGIPTSLVEDAIARRDELFWNRIDQEGVPLCPGVTETLNHLSQNFRLAVVTGASRKHYDRVHASSGLHNFFEAVITRDEYEQIKPHPQAYLKALQRLGLKPDDCLAVEDSPRGATAALAAGIRCFVIPTCLTDIALCPPDSTILENITCLMKLLDAGRDIPVCPLHLRAI
jgi:HAD superfamily hydrolase (TIGR01509 family)